MRRANYERENGTVAFGGFLEAERQRIMAAATPERRAQMEAAEQSRAIYRAWNTVCAGTREGRHVTGLRYLPEVFAGIPLVYVNQRAFLMHAGRIMI